MTPTGYRRPIPFDHVFFSRLDRWISFDPDEVSREEPVPENLCSPDLDPRMAEQPAEPIHHDLPNSLVVPHPPLAPWEDIPPYQRMRGYNDQPAYTDDYDDFLWLPRDPLSTLDMDDTVEMRLSITTSAGGSGRIGDWPCEPLEDEVATLPVIHEPDWQEVMMSDNGPVSPNTTVDTNCSPGAQSERRLIDDVELSPLIGSEIGGVRRAGSTLGLRNVTLAMNAFRRPKPHTVTSAESGISMQDLTSHSASMAGHDDTPSRPVRTASPSSNILAGERVGTPNSATQPDFGLPTRSEADPIRQSPYASGSARSQTLPLRPLDEENDPFLAPHTAPPLSIRIAGPRPMPGSSAMSPRTKHASHLTFADSPGQGRSPTVSASGLGRTASGRKPHNRLRSGTTNSRNSDRTAGGTQRSGSGILRTSSILVHERQASVSASQRALLKEVMEEEALASRNVKKDEAALTERERGELGKEKDRLRKSGLEVPGDAGGVGVARRGSWLESVHEMARGPSVRRPTLEE